MNASSAIQSGFNPMIVPAPSAPPSSSSSIPLTIVAIAGAGAAAYFLLPSFSSVGKSLGEGVGGVAKGVGEGIGDIGEGIGEGAVGLAKGAVGIVKEGAGLLKGPLKKSKQTGQKIGEGIRNVADKTVVPFIKNIGGLFKKKK